MRRLSNNAIAAFMVFLMITSLVSTTLISFYVEKKVATTGKAVSQTGTVGVVVNSTGGGGGGEAGGGAGGGGGGGGIRANKTHILDFRIKDSYVFRAGKSDTIIAIFNSGTYTFTVESAIVSETRLLIASRSFMISIDTIAKLDLNLDGFDDLYISYDSFEYTFTAVYLGGEISTPGLETPPVANESTQKPEEFIPAVFIAKPEEAGVLPLLILTFIVFFSLVSFFLIPKYPAYGVIIIAVIIIAGAILLVYIFLPKLFLVPPVVYFEYVNDTAVKNVFGLGLAISADNVTNCRLGGACRVIVTVNNTLNRAVRLDNPNLIFNFLDPLSVKNFTLFEAVNTNFRLVDRFRTSCVEYSDTYIFLESVKTDYVYNELREIWEPVFLYSYKNGTTLDFNCTTSVLKEKEYYDSWRPFESKSFVLRGGEIKRYMALFSIPDYSKNFYNFTFVFDDGSLKLDPVVQSGCGTLLTPNEIYEVNQSIQGNEADCIVVAADNVTVRCTAGDNSVINVTDTLSNDRAAIRTTYNNTVVEGCHIWVKVGGTAVYGINSGNLVIRNLTINGTLTGSGFAIKGVSLENSNDVIIANNTILTRNNLGDIVGQPLTSYGLYIGNQSNNITLEANVINTTTYAVFVKRSNNLTIKNNALLTTIFSDVVVINYSSGFLAYNNSILANVTNAGSNNRIGVSLGATLNGEETGELFNISFNKIEARNPIYVVGYWNSFIKDNNITQKNLSGAGVVLARNTSFVRLDSNNITSSNTTGAIGVNLTDSVYVYVINNSILTYGVAGHGLFEIGNNSVVDGGNITVIGFGTEYPIVAKPNVSNLTIKNLKITSKAGSGHCIYLQSVQNISIDSVDCLSSIDVSSLSFAGNGLYLQGVIDGSNVDIIYSNFSVSDAQRGFYFVDAPKIAPSLRVIGNNISLYTRLAKSGLYNIDLVFGYNNSVFINNSLYNQVSSSRGISLFLGSSDVYVENLKIYMNSSGSGIFTTTSASLSSRWNITKSYFNVTGTGTPIVFNIARATNWTIQDSVIERTARITNFPAGVLPLVNTFLNVTYFGTDSNFTVSGAGQIFVKYYLDVNVTNKSALTPIADVNITGYTQKNYTSNPLLLEFSAITGANGFTPRLDVTHFLANATGRYYYSNYTVYANSTSCNNQSSSVNMSASTQIDFILDGCPVGVVVSGGGTGDAAADGGVSKFGFGGGGEFGKPSVRHILDFRISNNYTFDVAKDDTITAIVNSSSNYTFVVDVVDVDKSVLLLSKIRYLMSNSVAYVDVDYDSINDLAVNYTRFYYTFSLIEKPKEVVIGITVEKVPEQVPKYFKIKQEDYTIILIILVLIISVVLYIQFRGLRKTKS